MVDTNKLLLGSLLATASLATYGVTISDIVDDVTMGSYSNYHINLFVSQGDSRGFSHNAGVREPAYQHDLARDYIASNFTAMGYDTWLDPFSFEFDGYPYTNANNVVGIKPGIPGTNIVVIGAHYDTVDIGHTTNAPVTTTCAGADDNGSGVAAMLETADTLKDYTFRDTIYFIAFDAEEKGLAGSTHFVDAHTTDNPAETNRIPRSNIEGMVSVDMIAFNLDSSPDTIILEANPSPVKSGLMQSFAAHTSLGVVEWPHVGASDHGPFNSAGIDTALIFEGDFLEVTPTGINILNHFMHSDFDSIDTPGVMDYEICTDVTKAVAGFLCGMAEAIPPATLQAQGISNDQVEVFFYPTAGVAYGLYGTTNLLTTNAWDFIQPIPVTNPAAAVNLELDVGSAPVRMFKVVGE